MFHAIDLIEPNKKIRPLIWALLETAATHGATVSEFENACKAAQGLLSNKFRGVLISELSCDGEAGLNPIVELRDFR